MTDNNINKEKVAALVLALRDELTGLTDEDYLANCNEWFEILKAQILPGIIRTSKANPSASLGTHLAGAMLCSFDIGFKAGRRYGFQEWQEAGTYESEEAK